MANRTCSVDGCESPYLARGMCSKHWQKWRKYGDPLHEYAWPRQTAAEALLPRLDKSGDCWIWAGAKSYKGYGQVWIDGRHRPAHRVSYELHVGPIPVGMHIDHMCFNKACCNPAHLRPVTNKQNLENMSGAKRGTRSGVRGVTWDGELRKWRVQVMHNGYNYASGRRYATIEEAERAAIETRNRLFTHNNVDRRKVTADG